MGKVEIYQTIRNEHYGHRSLQDEDSIWKKFQKTDVKDIGETLSFLCRLKNAVIELYLNGKEPSLDVHSDGCDGRAIRESVSRVLNKLTEGST